MFRGCFLVRLHRSNFCVLSAVAKTHLVAPVGIEVLVDGRGRVHRLATNDGGLAVVIDSVVLIHALIAERVHITRPVPDFIQQVMTRIQQGKSTD